MSDNGAMSEGVATQDDAARPDTASGEAVSTHAASAHAASSEAVSSAAVSTDAASSEAVSTDAAARVVAESVAAATYPVVVTVNVRSGPSTSYSKVGTVRAGTRVSISCQTPGQTIVGPLGTSNIWDRIGSGRYVSDTYVRTGSDGYVARRC